jgi:hypothetical protein
VAKGHDEEDDSQYIYEEVMKAIYGGNIFDYINEKLHDK